MLGFVVVGESEFLVFGGHRDCSMYLHPRVCAVFPFLLWRGSLSTLKNSGAPFV